MKTKKMYVVQRLDEKILQDYHRTYVVLATSKREASEKLNSRLKLKGDKRFMLEDMELVRDGYFSSIIIKEKQK